MLTRILLDLTLLLFAGTADPVTVMGQEVLPKTDLIIRATPLSRTRPGLGAELTSLEVNEVIHGRESARRLLVLSPDPGFFGPNGIACVVFLSRLRDGRYEGVARVDLAGADADVKIAVLRRYLEIEAIEDGVAKRKALHDYLLGNLDRGEAFAVFSAARELAHFTAENADCFTAAERADLTGRAAAARDPTLRDLLGTTVENLGGPVAEAGGAGGTERVPVDRHGVPAPHEFRALRRAWKEGPETGDERLRIVRAVTARHIKFAGPILLEALADGDARVREAAALGLGEGLYAKGREPLRRLLPNEKVSAVVKAAIQSLGFLHDEAALPAIIQLSKDPELVRTGAFAAARIGGPLAKDWLGTLRATYSSDRDEDREIRRTLEFLASDDFVKQEAALLKIREERLR